MKKWLIALAWHFGCVTFATLVALALWLTTHDDSRATVGGVVAVVAWVAMEYRLGVGTWS